MLQIKQTLHRENITHIHLLKQKKQPALQRLTALWAFVECGLGGVLHALHVPFTGLIIGGLAIFLITFIAQVSDKNYAVILKALLIVLMVKAIVSPYTPLPAYIAVSFQALLSYVLYNIAGINFFSIFLVATLAMIESAVQKLLILTLFFGQSLWKSIDVFINFAFHQMGLSASSGSKYIIATYLGIYFVGGIAIAWVTFKLLKKILNSSTTQLLEEEVLSLDILPNQIKTKKNKAWVLPGFLLLISLGLLLFSTERLTVWQAAVNNFFWSLIIIFIWFILINPIVTRSIRHTLLKKHYGYKKELMGALSFLPIAKCMTVGAWQKSAQYKGLKRWQYFIIILLYWSLTYSDINQENIPDNAI